MKPEASPALNAAEAGKQQREDDELKEKAAAALHRCSSVRKTAFLALELQ